VKAPELFCALALGALTSGGCANDGGRADQPPVVLRVAATGMMGRFEPAPVMEGAAAAAIELTHELASERTTISRRSELELVLSPSPSSGLTAQQIAATTRFEGIVDVRLDTDSQVLVRFSDAAHRADFETYGMLDRGPFRIEDPNARPVRLLRRGKSAIDVIEILDTTTQEQWRLMHGRKLDVLPVVGEPDRAELGALPSVRTVDIDTASVFALYFNLDSKVVSRAETRRAIVRALDRRAIAATVCGSHRCDVEVPDPPGPSDASLPPQLTMMVMPGNDNYRRAAEAVRHQLRAAGVAVDLREIDTTTDAKLFDSPVSAMTVTSWSRAPDSYGWFMSPSTGGFALTGYANPDYDRAVAQGDLDTARRLLERDVPVAPLLHMRYFAVIDNRFCGDAHPTATSWRWLADLRPCEPGESP